MGIPILHIYNSIEVKFRVLTGQSNGMFARIENGHVTYHEGVELLLECRMDLTQFPFDQQECHIAYTTVFMVPEDIQLQFDNPPYSLSFVSELKLDDYTLLNI